MTISSTELDKLVPAWLTVPDLAARLDLPVTKARQLIKDRQLLAVRRGTPPVLSIPAAFLDGAAVVKGLSGTITLLADNKYTDEEAIRWLFTPDQSLPGSPVEALLQDRGTEVRRRAHALGF